MDTRLFGTDGIRARVGEFPLNHNSIIAIGRAIGERLGGRVLFGQDTRISSPWIRGLLGKGLVQTATAFEDAGVIPTPAIALLTRSRGYSGGVMISASHNPYQDNGIKIFAADGTKLKDTDENAIEKRVFELLASDGAAASDEREEIRPDLLDIHGPTTLNNDLSGLYRQTLFSIFPEGQWLKGVRIVVDCANGAMSTVAPELLSRLGADVIAIHAAPTGTNINSGCGAVHVEALVSEMSRNTADFGVAFDGDGDRSVFVSSSGRRLDGDAVLLIMARRLNPRVVVGTLMTHFSLERMLEAEGIALTRVSVGDRFIFEEMQRSGAILGGEPSGHIIFSDFRLSGDGLLTTLKVAEVLTGEQESLDHLTRDWVESPQLLENVPVKRKTELDQFPAIQARIIEVQRELQGCGRLVVRYSGTEPLLRVMIESDDARRNETLMQGLLEKIRIALG